MMPRRTATSAASSALAMPHLWWSGSKISRLAARRESWAFCAVCPGFIVRIQGRARKGVKKGFTQFAWVRRAVMMNALSDLSALRHPNNPPPHGCSTKDAVLGHQRAVQQCPSGRADACGVQVLFIHLHLCRLVHILATPLSSTTYNPQKPRIHFRPLVPRCLRPDLSLGIARCDSFLLTLHCQLAR